MRPDPVARLRTAGVVLVAAAVAAQTTLHLYSTFHPSGGAWDVNAEYTVFAAASACTIGLAATACLIAARVGAVSPRRALLLAGILAFLAADEVLVIHERVGVHGAALLGLSGDWDSVLWPIMYLPLLSVLVLLLVAMRRPAPTDVGRLLASGLALLAAAVALEVLSAPWSTEQTAPGLVHALEGAVEEGLELMGWGLLALAMVVWSVRGPSAPLHRAAGRAPLR